MKTLKTLFLALTLVTTLFASRPSQAAVGAIFSPALVTAGVVMLKVGGVGIGASVVYIFAGGDTKRVGPVGEVTLMAGLLGWAAAFLGLVVLDDEQTVAYAPLHPEEARRLGLSELEARSFNEEVDQINALAAFVDSELAAMKEPTAEASAHLWLENQEALSPAAFAGLIKVTKQAYK